MNITANIAAMFSEFHPCEVSGSQAELGEDAGGITWRNALKIGANHAGWLTSDLTEACDGMRQWAKETGAWDREEIAAWSEEECLALFAQNIASELRMLGSDSDDFETCARTYADTDWDKESEYPIGYYCGGVIGDVTVEYYTGL